MMTVENGVRMLAVTVFALALGIADRRVAAQQGIGGGHGFEARLFGTVGLTPGQTARLNVVNTAVRGRPETRVLSFLDAAGNVIVDVFGNAVTRTVTIGPGESAFLDLNGADIPGGAGRVQIRALDPNCGSCGGAVPHAIVQTLEVLDSLTQHTELLYAPAQPDGPPGFAAPFGMIGLASGQTARLSVATPTDPVYPGDPMTPGDPIRVLLGFVKADGQPVTSADGIPRHTVVTLHPGESASFDLPDYAVLSGSELRAQIRAVVAPDGPPQRRLIPTLEIIETCATCTGKTSVLYAR